MSAEVAVVIPAFNSRQFLEATIASVREQTLVPRELVVVDDGSTDGTAELVTGLGVRCVRQENSGPAAARNHGVRETAAPLLAFLDADDRFLPDKLERQLALLAESHVVACCSNAWVIQDGKRHGLRNSSEVASTLTFESLLAANPVICSTMVLRRDAFDEAGGFDEDRVLVATEDYDLWLRVARLGRLAYMDAPLAEYRVHDASLSDSSRFLAGSDRIMDKVEERWGREPGVSELARQRRQAVRVDAAYDLARTGNGRRARQLLREAKALGGWGWKERKIWLRSLLSS
ncbi:MAG: glycosyltransferase family 2 protein [Planctomycetota bacterium]|jgi:glycosyltransferase involved in cell wall biosynthesis